MFFQSVDVTTLFYTVVSWGSGSNAGDEQAHQESRLFHWRGTEASGGCRGEENDVQAAGQHHGQHSPPPP